MAVQHLTLLRGNGGYGYSTLSRNVINGLKELGYDTSLLSMQQVGDSITPPDGIINYPVRYNLFFTDALDDYIVSGKPDLLITAMDIWINEGLEIVNIVKKHNLPWIHHVTISYSPITMQLYQKITNPDLLIAPSKFNYTVLANAGLAGKSIYIPHGIDPKTYHYNEKEKEEMKERFGLQDKFVFMVAARNRWYQKNLGQIIACFGEFLATVPEAREKARLLLLADIWEENPWALYYLRNQRGLQDYVQFVKCQMVGDTLRAVPENSPDSFYHNANFRFRGDEMRKIYNMADCYVTTSTGESFNLPSLESQACGQPQITPAHSTGFELVQEPKSGLLCDALEGQLTPQLSEYWLFSKFSMINCMKKMLLDKEFYEKCKQNALANAQNYTWDKIIPRWKNAIDIVENYYMTPNFQRNWLGI